MNVESYSLKPHLTLYTNNKNFVTFAKWALFSEPVTYAEEYLASEQSKRDTIGGVQFQKIVYALHEAK